MFEQLFKLAIGDGQSLDGGSAKELLTQKRLPESDP